MELQYISDNAGNHTAVIIPIEDWNIITSKHQDIKQLEADYKKKSILKPSDFVGIISKEQALQMITDIEESRNNWERDI